MHRKLIVGFTTVAIAVMATGCATAPRGSVPAPVAGEQSAEQQANVAMFNQMQQMREEIGELRNQVETKSFELDRLKDRVDALNSISTQQAMKHDRYAAETAVQTPDSMASAEPGEQATEAVDANQTPITDKAVATAPEVAATAASDGKDANGAQAEYDAAFNYLKQSRFGEAYDGFKHFLATYPDSKLSDNAQYWAGESLYATRDFDGAIHEFDKVIADHPNSDKVSEAMLKKGYSFYEMGQYDQASEVLKQVQADYPGSRVAVSAGNRLTQITDEAKQTPAPDTPR